MTKRIFRSILLVALVVLLAGMGLIMGALYENFTRVQQSQLQMEAQLAARGVEELGAAYFDALPITGSRITWIAQDGTVLYDSASDSETMENHANREEVVKALEQGWGESIRYSDTRMERSLYYAVRLENGTVLRLSSPQDTVLGLFLNMGQSILLVIMAALILSLVLASRLAKNIVKPLNELDLDDPLSNEGYDELAPLLHRIHTQQEQLQAQAANLRRKQEEFDAVTEHMREGLVLLGSEGTILSINPAAARFLGTAGPHVGKNILELNRMPSIRALLKSAYDGRHEKTTVKLSNNAYRLDASPVYSDAQLTGVVLLIIDVTQKEQAEQLRQEFTANVSHELKSPLHAISGYSELMAQGIARPKDVPQFAANIYSEAQRMIELVEDILKLSQLDEGAAGFAWKKLDLLELARQTVETMSPIARQAQVNIQLTGTKAELDGIAQLITSIVHNLCDNAVKYNHPGGFVTVTVSQTQTEAVLTVVDTGVGIPKEYQDRIFERFYRVDKSRSKEVGGTGLGLSIVKHAANILNAQITLESAPGAGTEVTVRFPKARAVQT